MHFGIDYGSKLAGTTVICYEHNQQLHLLQSEKKKDADAFIKQQIEVLKPQQVFIDAPLSLPAAFFGKGEDFFYRKGDRLLKAMSPMFLGGLTARAMRLRHNYLNTSILFQEIYPSFLVKTLFPDVILYKKDRANIPLFMELLSPNLPFSVESMPTNWHQVDGILAWFSGHRFLTETALTFGEESEGVIVI